EQTRDPGLATETCGSQKFIWPPRPPPVQTLVFLRVLCPLCVSSFIFSCKLVSHLFIKPCARICPVPFGGAFGNAEHLCGFFNCHTDEVTQLHQLGFLLILRGQLF